MMLYYRLNYPAVHKAVKMSSTEEKLTSVLSLEENLNKITFKTEFLLLLLVLTQDGAAFLL